MDYSKNEPTFGGLSVSSGNVENGESSGYGNRRHGNPLISKSVVVKRRVGISGIRLLQENQEH